MRPVLFACLLLPAACGGSAAPVPAPRTAILPDSFVILAGESGVQLGEVELLRQIAEADYVLLGEVHDNAAQHELRGRLIAAFAARRPAIVFEQLSESIGPIARPAEGETREAWLDRNGFDRASWKWPLHAPVVEAAIDHARSLWGSHLPREALRSVVREGEPAAPAHLRTLMQDAPLDSAAIGVLDRELIDGHCGQLPPNLVAGMRAAQTVRDAAMARALMRAGETGPAWLIAGNGHVRRDVAVPRLLRAHARDARVLAVGLLERSPNGAAPAEAARAVYDVVIVTPRVERPDPCAGVRR